MIDGQIIMQNGAASFGRLEQPAPDGGQLYATTFTDTSGLAVTIVWEAATLRGFLEKSIEAMAGLVPVPKPRLEIVRTMPGGAA